MVTFSVTLTDLTRFSRSRRIWSWISYGTKLLQNANRKPYTVYRMVPLSMTVMNPKPVFKVTTFMKSDF